MRKDNQGRKLFRHMDVKILFPSPLKVHFPDGKNEFTRRYVADPGMGYHRDGMEKILEDIVAMIERQYSQFEFEMVELLSGNQFNFVCKGLRAKVEATPNP